MKVTVSGATGRVGRHLVAALKERGDDVVALSRDPDRASEQLGVQAYAWDLKNEAVPRPALEGRDAVVHLAGEDPGQRWNAEVKAEILDSREKGTRNMVHSIFDTKPRPRTFVCASASGYYGARGSEPVDETEPPGEDWLAEVCTRWERQADTAKMGIRLVIVRTGLVLDAGGGALPRMLPPFKAGLGGPIGGGKQYMPWIHLDDLVGIYLAALDHPTFNGAINASAPEPVTNKQFAKALGRAVNRPAVAPVPGFTIKLMYGEMSQIVLKGVRMVPGRAAELGYEFQHTDLDEALRSALEEHPAKPEPTPEPKPEPKAAPEPEPEPEPEEPEPEEPEPEAGGARAGGAGAGARARARRLSPRRAARGRVRRPASPSQPWPGSQARRGPRRR